MYALRAFSLSAIVRILACHHLGIQSVFLRRGSQVKVKTNPSSSTTILVVSFSIRCFKAGTRLVLLVAQGRDREGRGHTHSGLKCCFALLCPVCIIGTL